MSFKSFKPQSLLAQFTLRVLAPLSLLLFLLLGLGFIAYQGVLTALVVDRDLQLARLAASRVSTHIEGRALSLIALAANADVRSSDPALRANALTNAAEALDDFDAGLAILDAQGNISSSLASEPFLAGNAPALRSLLATLPDRQWGVSDEVMKHANSQQDMIVIGAAILDETGKYAGALLGGQYLTNASLRGTLEQLVIGSDGFAYLVDGEGRVIFHPDVDRLGTDFTERPFVRQVTAGESGGTLWTSPEGEQLVVGHVPVSGTRWGLIMREPLDAVVAPAQNYALAIAAAGVAIMIVAALLIWRGVQRIVSPISLLAAQTARLASGEEAMPLRASGIREIDVLERSFSRMADRITRYRAGLRRYVGSVTQSQEQERQRISRELHDETAQNLLAISRRLELLKTSQQREHLLTQLQEVRDMVADTLKGVRRISRDLRPPILEDLGLVPALQSLVRAMREGEGALPHSKFELIGDASTLSPDDALTIYRISQEALSNVRKHANATSVRVKLALEPAQVLLEISDDGRGFEVPFILTDLAQEGHFGLTGIQERVWAAGGTLSIKSAPGLGTRLRVILPARSQKEIAA